MDTGEYSFLQLHGKDDTWKPTSPGGLSLAETKIAASRFLASGAFTESQRFLPALFASADTNSRISDVGDDILKRATPAISLEDSTLVTRLYGIYLGSRGEQGSLPARPPLQTKILGLLCRSKQAASHISESTQIVQEGLAPQQNAQQNGNFPTAQKGLEASKLRGQIFAFTNWLARISDPSEINTFAPTLVGQLRTYIEDQGWPRPRTDEPLNAGELSSRTYGYESIGLLASAAPQKLLVEPNLELLRWLLTSLSEDPCGNDVSLSIEHAISSVIRAFGHGLTTDIETALASLFLHHMRLVPDAGDETSTGVVRSTRFVAIKFANRSLPYDSIDGRFIDVLALCGLSEERSEVLEEARKGLSPYWYRMLNPQKSSVKSSGEATISEVNFPALEPLIERLFGSEASWNISNAHLASAYMTTLQYCRCVLMHQALVSEGSSPVIDSDWERNIDALITNDEEVREKVLSFFSDRSQSDSGFSRALKVYLHACFRGITGLAGGLSSQAGTYLLELLLFVPIHLYADLTKELAKLQKPIFSTNMACRETAAHIFGLLASLEDCSSETLRAMDTAFERRILSWQKAIGSEVLEVHGSVLARAFFLSRTLHRGTRATSIDEQCTAFISVCVAILRESKDKTLLEGAFNSVSQLSLFSATTTTSLAANQMELVVQQLSASSKEGNEKAILALGHLSSGCLEENSAISPLSTIIDKLYDLHTVRQPNVQFAVGEALSCAAVGWESKALVPALDITGPYPKSALRNNTLPVVLDHVLRDCRTTKPSLRQATVIWLLCLLQFCGHLPAVTGRLRECQAAFKSFLTDRDTLNQESASRGLTLVYEKGDKDLRDTLIRDLVGSFTGSSTGMSGTVSEDTELFDAGALPTGDGSITTYKDIMSLAAEVGDSTLVYKFMSLASHDAIWSSRAAFGRFGLTNILSDASNDGYLASNPKLYPALFRYRFDPNTNVRNAMNDIWTALVKDGNATINENFDAIMKDLFKNILGKEWRTRQASCAAIADLVQGRQLEIYEKYLEEIWGLTFKVCDDIKESVRVAAMSLARVLTGILTRALEASDSSAKTAEKMLKQILPFLLSTQGLESGAAEVQDFSRKTILQIIKKSNGKTLRPFLPELVGRLLALLSSIEPEMINYLHMNAETFGVTKQQLDDARLKHIRGSSMLEAIERCLDYLDESSMLEFNRSLENAIKTVIGLPSKVGCSRVLVSLATRQNFLFQPYADGFLQLARKQVFDRNDTISSAYASACGYLARLATDEALFKMVEGCRKLYFDSDDDRERMIAGDMIYCFSKYATDKFNSLGGEVLPFVFVAKHDQHDRAKSFFEDTWNENVGGSRTVLLYLKEIIQLSSQYLESARWSVKHTSAFAIADVVNSAGTNISDADAGVIWPALEKALSGKTWEGKEKVLKAFVQFTKNSQLFQNDSKISEQMVKIMLRESKRNNVGYRQHAMGCLAEFIESPNCLDMYEQVHSIVEPIIEELCTGSEDMDIDSTNSGPSSKTVKELTISNALTALLRSIRPSNRKLPALEAPLKQSMSLIERVLHAESGSKTIQAAIYEALGKLFQDMHAIDDIPTTTSSATLDEILLKYIQLILDAGDQVEHIRLKAAEAALAIAPLARKRGGKVRDAFVQGLEKVKIGERSASVQGILDNARKALDS